MGKRTYYQDVMEGLKEILKKRRLSYKDVATAINLSESSVKRLFNAKDGQLGKIESLCEWLEIQFSDLSDLIEEAQDDTYITNPEQENAFLKTPGALQFFVELKEYNQSVEQIEHKHGLSKKSVQKYLTLLEKLKLIEQHPENKIKVLIKGFFSINDNGELAKKLLRSSMANITDYTIAVIEKKNSSGGQKSSMKIGELLFTKSSLEEVFLDLQELNKKMVRLSSRDMRIFPKHELTSYQYINGLIPQRMLQEKIPNI